ncbi:zinc finger, CCHC-type containing protein, partial [Tanacetum coccineum]
MTTLMPELMEDDIVEAIRRRAKWENNDYICRGHILNGMFDSLFDIYHNIESAKELWDSLEFKYLAEDASSKKFLVSNFNNYKMVDSRPVMEQFNELLRILGQYTQHGLKMDESISISSVIDKLPQESLRAQESDKGKGKEVVGPFMNMTEDGKNKNNKQNKRKKRGFDENNGSSGSNKKTKLECWKRGKTGHFKRDCRSGNKKSANDGGSEKGLMQLHGGLIPVPQLMFVKIIAGLRHMNRWWTGLYMDDDHFAPVYGKRSVVLEFISEKSITLFNLLYVPKLRFGYYNNGHVHYKRMLEMSKNDLIPVIDEVIAENPGK